MKSLLVKCITLLLVFAGTAFAQEGQTIEDILGRPSLEGYQFEFGGGGARADAMGRAFLGLSNDVTAISWNPAGLYDLSQPIISVTYGSTMPRGFTDTDVYVPNLSNRLDHTGSLAGVTSLNFAAPLRVKGHPFVGSFAYWNQYNEYQALLTSDSATTMFTIITGTGAPQTYIIDYLVESSSEMDGGLKTATFGIGTRIYGNLSAGLGLNVYSGSIVRGSVSRSHTDNFFDPLSQQVSQTTMTSLVDSNSFSGYNVTLGFKYNKEKFGVGLVVRTPFELKVETDRTYETINLRNGQLEDIGTDTIYFDNLLAKYDMPLMVGLGFAFLPSDRSTVTLDLEYRGFSSAGVQLREDLQLDPGGENEEIFSEVSSDTLWNNTFQFRVGGEYMLSSKIGRIPVRGGFAYMPSLVPSYEPTDFYQDDEGNFILEASKKRATGVRLSAGSGIWWNQIHLDVAYSYLTRDWDTGQPGASRTGVFHEKIRNHNLSATFTGYF